MIRLRRCVPIALLLVSSACAAGRGGSPQPDPRSPSWRQLVGCWEMGDGQFALDSVPDLELNSDRPGVRIARFTQAPIVGAYWFVTRQGAVWLVRHDGLWGRTWELRAQGDSLVGRGWVRTDVPGCEDPPEPATAVRAASCRVPAQAATER